MYKKLATKDQVDQAITNMATSIINDYHDKRPLFVCLLRGAAPFAMKLMTEITRQAPDFHPDLDYMTIKTYGDQRTAGQPKIVMDLAPTTDITNRPVVVLDDVLDTGVTAAYVADTLLRRGAKSTAIAVLVRKDIPDQVTQADYVAFTAGKEWLAGVGMDDDATHPEAYRWSEEIIAFN